jgi:hypothetical protein
LNVPNNLEEEIPDKSLGGDKYNLIFILLAVFLAFIFGVYLRLELLDVASVNEWVARDFDRAFNIVEGNYFPLAGPEVNNGGRLPGPFMYIFLSIPLLFNKSYESIFIFNLILNLGSILGLFFVLKRFFNTYFASLAASLVSLNIFHIGAVQFPINPSFLFPFVVLFLWFLLEFLLNKKQVFFLLAILVFCLSIQFHYSFATYLLVLIILCGVFKINISKSIFFRSFLIAAFCFSPYFFYKTQTFIPSNQGIGHTITKPDMSTLVNLAKIVTLQNSIPNIISPVKYLNGPETPQALKNFYYFITTISMFFLAARLFFGRKFGLNVNFEKEMILFIFFYAPGFAFELANPKSGHYWYAFIFVIPQTLIIAYFLTSILQGVTQKIPRVLLSVGLFVGLCVLANTGHDFIFKGMEEIRVALINGSNKSFKLVLSNLKNELNLNSQQFLKQVYLLGFRPTSYRRTAFAFNEENILKKMDHGSNKSCYFIFQSGANKDQIRKLAQKTFKNDKTINRFPLRVFSLKVSETLKSFIITRYIPKYNQSCYNNLFNPFVVTKEIRDLLVHAKSIKLDNKSSVQYKTVFSKGEYNESGELISFKGSYVINSPITQTPFQFNLNLEKKDVGYSLKGEITSFYYWASPGFNLNKLDVYLNRGSTFNSKSVDFNRIEILSEKTLASVLNFLGNSIYWNYNRNWYRTVNFKPKYKLTKNNVRIGIIWSVLWDNSNKDNYSQYSEDNMVTFLPEIQKIED